jgi:UDP-glucose 4-epimerase
MGSRTQGLYSLLPEKIYRFLDRHGGEPEGMKWNSAKVLVTGGGGFLGLHLVNRLCALGAEVTVFDNLSGGTLAQLRQRKVNLVEGSVMNEQALASVGEVDYIFHLASPSSVMLFNKNPQECFRETTEGWLNVLNFGKHNSVKKIVFPSSGSLYGHTPPPHAETKEPRPTNLYAVSKLACENMIDAFDDLPKIATLRIFAGYGPGEDHKGYFASPVTLFLKKIVNNERPIIFGDGNQTRDFVYIDDIIDAMIKSIESTFAGTVNVGSGVLHSFNEVVDIINHKLNKKIEPSYVPKPANYLERTLADVSRMKSVLGITPLSLEDGINRYWSKLSLPSKV